MKKPKFMTSNEEFYYNDLQTAKELLQDFSNRYVDDLSMSILQQKVREFLKTLEK